MGKKTNSKKAIVNLFILDSSASMSSIKKQIIDGFNEQLDTIIRMSKDSNIKSFAGLTFFSSDVDVRFSADDVDKLYKLDDNNYIPSSCTSMYDGIGKSVKALDAKLGGYMEACNVVVTILTDGQENSSREYCGSQISDMIEEYRENLGWTFNFIGANIDVESLANTLNISRGNTLSFTSDSEGTRKMMDSYSRSVVGYYASAAKGDDVSDTKCFMSNS